MVPGHHRPEAAVAGVHRRPAEIEEAIADLRDLKIIFARSVTDSGRRTSFDEVLAAFGHTRDSIAAVEDE